VTCLKGRFRSCVIEGSKPRQVPLSAWAIVALRLGDVQGARAQVAASGHAELLPKVLAIDRLVHTKGLIQLIRLGSRGESGRA
jgi:hypothetical protein